MLHNKELLVSLSREYEALRRQGTDIDYQAWITAKLKQHATASAQQPAALQASKQHTKAPSPPKAAQEEGHTQSGVPATPPPAVQHPPAPPSAQLEFSFPQTQAEPALEYTLLPHPGTPPHHTTNAHLEMTGEGVRAFDASRPKGAGQARPHINPPEPSDKEANKRSKARPLSNPPVPSGRRGRHPSHHTSRYMQGATDQERRLALSTALAKERISLGQTDPHPQRMQQQQQDHLSAAEARSVAERNWAREAAQAEQAQVLHMAQQLLQKHDGLAAAMQATNEQVTQQQALLQAALERLSTPPPPPPPQPASLPKHTRQRAPSAHEPPPFCITDSLPAETEDSQQQLQLSEPVAAAWFVRAALPDAPRAHRHNVLPTHQRQEHRQDRDAHHSRHARKDRGAREERGGRQDRHSHKQQLKASLRELLSGGKPTKGEEQRGSRGKGQLSEGLQRLLQVLQGASGADATQTKAEGVEPTQQPQQPTQQQQQQPQPQPAILSVKDRVKVLKQQYSAAHALGAPLKKQEPQTQGAQPVVAWPLQADDLEDQAQQILIRDAEALQHQSRLSKVDQLEERLATLASCLEQQLQQQQALHATAAAAAAQAGAEARAQSERKSKGQDMSPHQLLLLLNQQQQREAGGVGSMVQPQQNGSGEDLSAVELHLLMGRMQRLEEQERALRDKWIRNGPRSNQDAISVYDGQVHTMALHMQDGGKGAGEEQGPHLSSGAPTGSKQLSAADPIDNTTLENVMVGRRAFLRHQQQRDGDLIATSNPRLNPVDVVEDVADMLLDELLMEQAKDLLNVCDSIGDDLFEAEFNQQ